MIRSNKLAISMCSKNMFIFWKEVRSHTNVLSKVATKVDCEDCDEGIARVFFEKNQLHRYLEYVIIQW